MSLCVRKRVVCMWPCVRGASRRVARTSWQGLHPERQERVRCRKPVAGQERVRVRSAVCCPASPCQGQAGHAEGSVQVRPGGSPSGGTDDRGRLSLCVMRRGQPGGPCPGPGSQQLLLCLRLGMKRESLHFAWAPVGVGNPHCPVFLRGPVSSGTVGGPHGTPGVRERERGQALCSASLRLALKAVPAEARGPSVYKTAQNSPSRFQIELESRSHGPGTWQ